MTTQPATWEIIAGRSLTPAAYLRAYDAGRWADYDRAGARVATGQRMPGYSSSEPTAEQLADWDTQATHLAARLAAFPFGDVPLFIRWRDVPRGGRSRNHATGQREAGVSCYAARYNPTTDRIEYADQATLADAALTSLILGHPAYLITGTVVGAGSDGEPVVSRVRVLAPLTPTERGFTLLETTS